MRLQIVALYLKDLTTEEKERYRGALQWTKPDVKGLLRFLAEYTPDPLGGSGIRVLGFRLCQICGCFPSSMPISAWPSSLVRCPCGFPSSIPNQRFSLMTTTGLDLALCVAFRVALAGDCAGGCAVGMPFVAVLFPHSVPSLTSLA
jgi:hypothetical protein